MAPKTPLQKTVNYENDSFEVWLQKTNVISSEQGDLNHLPQEIYTPNPQTPDAKPILGSVYTQVNGSGIPTKIFGIATEFTKHLKVGDLVAIHFTSLDSSHVFNDHKTYLFLVKTITSDIEVSVDAVYSGPQPYPQFSTSSQDTQPLFVKQVNLVDSISKMQGRTSTLLRKQLINAIGMS